MPETVTERFEGKEQQLRLEATLFEGSDSQASVLSMGENPSVVVDDYELSNESIIFEYEGDVIGACVSFEEEEYQRLKEWLDEYNV